MRQKAQLSLHRGAYHPSIETEGLNKRSLSFTAIGSGASVYMDRERSDMRKLAFEFIGEAMLRQLNGAQRQIVNVGSTGRQQHERRGSVATQRAEHHTGAERQTAEQKREKTISLETAQKEREPTTGCAKRSNPTISWSKQASICRTSTRLFSNYRLSTGIYSSPRSINNEVQISSIFLVMYPTKIKSIEDKSRHHCKVNPSK